MVQKWTQNFLPEIQAGIAVEFERSQRAGVFNFLPVMPRSQNQKNFVVFIFWLERLVNGDCVITRVCQHLAPETSLLQPMRFAQLACRSLHIKVVVIKMVAPPLGFILA